MTSVNGHRADATTLTGVSETALLTLRSRANEARRPDTIIDDPMAIKLMDSLHYDFAKFGFNRRQDVALRALAFDNNARRYLAAHPSATVVALAEGLQTSFWRLDATADSHEFRWLTVDLPPIVELRRRLLPPVSADLDARTVGARLLAGWTTSTRRRACSSPPRAC